MKKPQALIGLLAALGTALGVMVAVIGLPYGRADYTAFAELYHGTTDTTGFVHMVVDTDTTSASTEASTIYPIPGTASVDADVTLGNSTGADLTTAAFNFTLDVQDPGATKVSAVASSPCTGAGLAATCNPQLLIDTVSGPNDTGWSCGPPPPEEDLDASAANGFQMLISCNNAADPSVQPASTAHRDLARVKFTTTGGLGIVPLVLTNVNVFDNLGAEVLGCNPGPGPCADGEFVFAPPPPDTETPTPAPDTPTNTPTNTATPTDTPVPPTSTNTPAGSGLIKVPESCIGGDAVPVPTVAAPANGNCVPGAPALANLWICESGPCDGPGEGALKVYEVAQTVDAATPGGLGAYEFSVEYDNFVISSVNPCDIVFGPTGAGSARGPVNELNTSAANDDCADDPNSDADGTCAMSHILENVVHFGCVTSGPTPPNGPTGTFTLASLLLIPHEDLADDLFPGNDNGVVTILKDNGCELVDAFGHPVPGSINGGLTSFCEDLAVTVRILEGDLDLDCDVDVTDAQAIAGHYGAFFGSLLYSKWLDLEPNLHDLDIDIKDVQKVFGRIGSDCQAPVPAQTPVPFN